MSEEQTPAESVPPASRVGEIVGWGLLALAVACFIAFIVAADSAYREATLLRCLSLCASFAFLSLSLGYSMP